MKGVYHMHSGWRLLLIALVTWVALVPPAMAQSVSYDGATSESFSCSGGRASGSLYDSGTACPATLKGSNVFSFLVCNMEKLSANLMGNMYCGVVQELEPMVSAVVVLAVVIFGVGFTTGVIPATAREFQLFLLKVTLIYLFATNADFLIGIGYTFLVNGVREGVAISLSSLFPDTDYGGAAVTGGAIYQQLDKFLGVAMKFATDYIGGGWASGDANPCKNAVFAVMAIMAVAFPPMFYIGVLIILKVAITFLRAVFGYIYAIMGLTFLLILSPFFLSFFLFRQTRPLFDRWTGYIASFSLQMILVFAFLAFIVSIDVKNISSGLTDIIIPVQEEPETTALRFPWQYCTLCKFQVVDANGQPAGDRYGASLKDGKLQCLDPKEPVRVLDGVSPSAGAEIGTSQQAPDKDVQNALLKFTGTGLLSLLVLAYIVDALLSFVPYLAQFLAGGMGAGYAPQLGGGLSPRSIPTAEMPGGALMDTFERGYTDGFAKASREGKSAFGAVGDGLSEGASRFFWGRAGGNVPMGERTAVGGGQDQGMVDSFIGFFFNPHREYRD